MRMINIISFTEGQDQSHMKEGMYFSMQCFNEILLIIESRLQPFFPVYKLFI
jgi:hypothetical protein